MVICPKCKTQYPDGAEFCERDGAKLLVGRDSVPASTSPESSSDNKRAARTDESHNRELQKLRAELAQRDERIAQLESQLSSTRRELEQIHAAPTSTPSPGSSKKSASAKRALDADESEPPDTTEFVAPPPATYGWLVCVGGTMAGQRYEIGPKGLEIGRAKKYADAGGISVKDNRVSNPHAWIGAEKNIVIVRDKGSTNGTFLNDPNSKRLEEAPLTPGDTIIIAERGVAEFVFRR